MRAGAIDRVFQCPGLQREIEVIAADLASDEHSRADLRQEMWCHLLPLPRRQAKKFYARAARRHAALYRARTMIDAPMGDDGWPILHRQTVTVGGLPELDRIHRRQRAA